MCLPKNTTVFAKNITVVAQMLLCFFPQDTTVFAQNTLIFVQYTNVQFDVKGWFLELFLLHLINLSLIGQIGAVQFKGIVA